MNKSAERDKFKAVWVSHSSINDFLKCPRAYYLRNVYKDPKTGRKITIVTPPLALGQAVHTVIESLSELPSEDRFKVSLLKKFDETWGKVTGKKGGFTTKEEEDRFKERGVVMLKNLEASPGLLLNKAIKIKSEINLPNYWMTDEDNIILCGKIDWLEYLDSEDAIHIVDFKTGKNFEEESSLQLPIYLLIANNTQKRKVKKASYWYLDGKSELVEKELPDAGKAFNEVYKIATRIKLARQLNRFVCPTGGCRQCLPYEEVLKGKGELVGTSDTRQDIYFLAR